jgi:hypothetical protein
MNYGRYFRLNQALSKVVSGVAIYDYVDLPAYFGPSVDNPMSPKYPINVTITSDTISFRLHYSAYKLEKKSNFVEILENDGKKRLINKEFPQYAYDEEGINNKSLPKVGESGLTDIGMAHMEEVILDLPFADTSSSRLSDTIKKIYNSTFPQVIDENTSMGGRYLEQLIKKRYPIEKDKESENDKGGVEEILYRNLRKMSDETASYSTLWLMDLVRDNRIYLYSKQKIKDDKTKKEKEIDVITGFLRKLLLDFMFDLKHSDVFQNSACYQKMYSRLMSNFYFSALMHKCEYYYYRKLTREAIDEIENGSLDRKTKKQRKESIKVLYANELVKAEDLWVQDIMNPQAEKDFEHRYPGKSKIRREIFGGYSFQQWPSWFAEPEEEMRRVCFTMKEGSGIKHICNADTLVEYLKVNEDSDQISISMLATRNSNRELISRWFLKRYDFNDVIHLHLFKHLNVSLLLIIVFFLTWLFGIEIIGSDFSYEKTNMRIIVTGISVILCPFIGNLLLNYASGEWAVKTRQELILKRTTAVIILVIISISLYYIFDKYIDSLWGQIVYILFSIVAYCLFFKITPYIHPISSLHLLFPRLVAAITAAWLTMSMGFDIYVSFFDAKPSLPTAISIAGIVFGFIMYEINRIMPSSSVWRKLFRSLEFLVISYCASLIVGLAVINFVGEKYLERGGYMEDYYKEYVNGNKESVWNRKFDYNKLEGKTIDTVSIHGKVDALSQISHKNNNKPFITKHQNIFNTGHNLYVMRDFLIMFSFIAMFWGIFIQMIFTGEKQMTEL